MVDERVALWLESGGDTDMYFDLRELRNGKDGQKFASFWEEAAKYLSSEVGLGAEPNRAASDGSLTYASSIISIPIFIREVAKRLHASEGHEQDPIPSRSCVELQFHPACPSKLSAGRFSSRFRVSRGGGLLRRVLRKNHPDAHVCNALAKYCKEKTVLLRDLARKHGLAGSIMAVGSDDKQAIPFGPPGLPISSAVHPMGPVMVSLDSEGVLAVDHDCCRSGTVTVSVDMIMDIPEAAADSWFSGQLNAVVRDTVTSPSHSFQHGAQLVQLLRERSGKPLLYTSHSRLTVDRTTRMPTSPTSLPW